jgi:hypothetical protein
MPPAAATAAARRTTAQPVEPNSYPEAYTKRAGQAIHTTHAPRAPRRSASVAAPPRPAAPRPAAPRPRTAPARPRTAPHTAPTPARRSHTVAPSPRPIRIERPAPRPLRVERPRPRVGLIARLPRGGQLLDSIVRGRAWIPVIGVLLVGIVAMRVEVLKLGSSVGSEIQQVSVLQSANAVMLKQVSALSDNTRIERDASKLGMVMPGPLDHHFVQASSGNSVNRAIADITEPSPAGFLGNLENERKQDGESADAAALSSAIGVAGGGAIDGGTSSAGSSAPGDTQGTDSVVTNTSDATDPTATDPTATDPTATDPTNPGASDTAGAPDPTSTDMPVTTDPSSAGTTDDTPPVSSTETNGAASLAG